MRELLKELGLTDTTIIAFSGDNERANKYFPNKEYPEGVFSPNVNPRTGVKIPRLQGANFTTAGLHVPFAVCWRDKSRRAP